ncbi:monocarboxylate transporter 7-like [Amphiura filiformis]|uniref:monocarboxylate transporter 7-like n=1 Tax=Amphiura filiformis TaxID=82378 RepID=UPI003B218ED3
MRPPMSDSSEKLPITEPARDSFRHGTFRGFNRRGWLIVVAGFILDIPFMGMVMSFGELLLPLLDTFGGSTAAISWVGSIGFGMAYVMNPISTPLYNRFGCQPVSMFGVILGAVALFLCSFVKKFWFMFFTYSLMFGFATNLCYNPPLILTGAWFPTRHHVLATCTLVAGIPFGSLVMNPVCQSLVEAIGLSNTYRTLSALTLIIGIPCCLVLKQPVVYGDEDTLIDDAEDTPIEEQNESYPATSYTSSQQFSTNPSHNNFSRVRDYFLSIFKPQPPVVAETDITTDTLLCGCRRALWTDKVFLLYMFGQLMKGIGYVFPFIHLVSFMNSIGIEPSAGSLIMTVKGAADMCGRLTSGVLGERVPFQLIHIYVACTGIMAATTYCATFARTFAHMFFYAVFIGFFNGVFNSLLFPTTTSLFQRDLAREAWAFCQVPPGIAIIIGPGIAGLIYDSTKSYIVDFYVNTGIFEVAMVIFLCIPGMHLYRRLKDAREGLPPGGSRRKSNVVEMTKLYNVGNGGTDHHQVTTTNMNSTVYPMPNGYQTMGQ